MSKETLSDCFEHWEKLLRENKEPTLIVQEIVKRIKEITKEHIQNAERRLKAPIESELKITEKHDSHVARTVKLILNQILKNQDKIFKEEFGELSGEK